MPFARRRRGGLRRDLRAVPIGWIVLNLIFLYQLTVERGWFRMMRATLGGIAPDRACR